MNDYPSNVKEKLNFIISDMANHHWLFANRSGHDFMRQSHGKLSFYDTMRLIIGMGAVFCMICDLIARMALAPVELNISTVTSILGAPIVIYMMIPKGGRK